MRNCGTGWVISRLGGCLRSCLLGVAAGVDLGCGSGWFGGRVRRCGPQGSGGVCWLSAGAGAAGGSVLWGLLGRFWSLAFGHRVFGTCGAWLPDRSWSLAFGGIGSGLHPAGLFPRPCGQSGSGLFWGRLPGLFLCSGLQPLMGRLGPKNGLLEGLWAGSAPLGELQGRAGITWRDF